MRPKTLLALGDRAAHGLDIAGVRGDDEHFGVFLDAVQPRAPWIAGRRQSRAAGQDQPRAVVARQVLGDDRSDAPQAAGDQVDALVA